MRKPRDYDSELKALEDRAKKLKTRQVKQLGELVVATGADALPVELLAGLLLSASDANAPTKEAWRTKGEAFFQASRRRAAGAAENERSGQAGSSTAAAAGSEASA